MRRRLRSMRPWCTTRGHDGLESVHKFGLRIYRDAPNNPGFVGERIRSVHRSKWYRNAAKTLRMRTSIYYAQMYKLMLSLLVMVRDDFACSNGIVQCFDLPKWISTVSLGGLFRCEIWYHLALGCKRYCSQILRIPYHNIRRQFLTNIYGGEGWVNVMYPSHWKVYADYMFRLVKPCLISIGSLDCVGEAVGVSDFIYFCLYQCLLLRDIPRWILHSIPRSCPGIKYIRTTQDTSEILEGHILACDLDFLSSLGNPMYQDWCSQLMRHILWHVAVKLQRLLQCEVYIYGKKRHPCGLLYLTCDCATRHRLAELVGTSTVLIWSDDVPERRCNGHHFLSQHKFWIHSETRQIMVDLLETACQKSKMSLASCRSRCLQTTV